MAKKTGLLDYFLYSCERLFSYLFVLLAGVMPLRCFYPAAELFGSLASFLIPRHRRRVMGNLDLAFGDEKTQKEKLAICRDFNAHLVKSYFEMLYSTSRARQSMMLASVRIIGREHLDQCLQKGKGVIAFGGHLGSFTILGLKMNKAGYRFHTVVRSSVDPLRNKMYEQFRLQQIQPFIYTHRSRQAAPEIIRALRSNEVVFLIADENERSGGVFVNFFNRLAATTPGPAILHLRTGAPLVPLFFFRSHHNTHTIVIAPPLALSPKGARKEAIEEITRMITQKIEEHVRKYPSQWMWTHRRWRTRPPEEKDRGIDPAYQRY